MARIFDWQKLLDEQRIEYVTSGKNVSRGEINIRCPFCGSADPSYHMGLSLETGWWSCWRNRSQHSGKSPVRLIVALLRVPYGRAKAIAGLEDDYTDPDGFDAVAARILGRESKMPEPGTAKHRFLQMGKGFVPITEGIATRRHWNYLYTRGFNGKQRGTEEVDLLVKQYDLRASFESKWTDRVIMPFYLDRELVTWTGRAIGAAEIRYKDLSLDESILGPKQTLYNADCIQGGGVALILQEGPFDVLKVDFFGRRFGIRSVGLATNSMTDDQAYLMKMAEGKFERLLVMMDTKKQLGLVDSMRMQQQLAFIKNVKIIGVPYGAGDGGAMSGDQVIKFSNEIIRGVI